ncbi:MAG: hypothetical protein ACM362_10610, partial [Candidatus Methylomirabilota bacterium]
LDEIRKAEKMYRDGLTLMQVRNSLAGMGYKSRSVNTIRKSLCDYGVPMRRPGRRRSTTIDS